MLDNVIHYGKIPYNRQADTCVCIRVVFILKQARHYEETQVQESFHMLQRPFIRTTYSFQKLIIRFIQLLAQS